MKFEEVLPALKEGKKIKQAGLGTVYLLDDKSQTFLYQIGKFTLPAKIDYYKIISNDWEIVE